MSERDVYGVFICANAIDLIPPGHVHQVSKIAIIAGIKSPADGVQRRNNYANLALQPVQ